MGIFNTPQLGTPVLDSFRIFSHFEQRNLASALRFFCGRDLCGAHGALADAQAAQDVLLAEVGGLVVAGETCRTGCLLVVCLCSEDTQQIVVASPCLMHMLACCIGGA